MAYTYSANGVFLLKRKIQSANLSTLAGSPEEGYVLFYNSGIQYRYFVVARENGKFKLYYATDYDLQYASTYVHVYTDGEGWVNNQYRAVSFGKPNTETSNHLDEWVEFGLTIKAFLTANTVPASYHEEISGDFYDLVGVRNLGYNNWVLPDRITWNGFNTIDVDVTFTVDGYTYTRIVFIDNPAAATMNLYRMVNGVETRENLYNTNGIDYGVSYCKATRRVINFSGDTTLGRDNYALIAFILSECAETLSFEFQGDTDNDYKSVKTFTVGERLTCKTKGCKIRNHVRLQAAPYVGTCRAYYENRKILEYDVTTKGYIAGTGETMAHHRGRGFAFICSMKLMRTNLIIEADGKITV